MEFKITDPHGVVIYKYPYLVGDLIEELNLKYPATHWGDKFHHHWLGGHITEWHLRTSGEEDIIIYCDERESVPEFYFSAHADWGDGWGRIELFSSKDPFVIKTIIDQFPATKEGDK